MVGKDITAQGLNSLTDSFKSAGLTKHSAASGDFSKTMSQVQENQTKAASDTAKGKKKEGFDGTEKLTVSKKPEADSEKRLEGTSKEKDALAKLSKDTGSDREEGLETENAIVLASGQLLTTQLLEQGLGDLEEKITDLVTEIMDMTEEELMDMLEQSGMQLLDLLNPDNLKQLVLNANGCEDAISLITNEAAADQFYTLLEGMNALEPEEELGITKEELANLLEEQGDLAKTAFTEQDGSEKAAKAAENDTEEAVPIVVERRNGADTQSSEGFQKKEELEGDGMADRAYEASNEDTMAPVDVFVQNLTAADANGVKEASAQEVQTMKEIVNQIVEQIKITIKPESASMELQLNPESLGRVNLTVASKNGVLTASFTAENQITKEAIESQMQVLKDNLNNQGVKVEAIEVNVSQFGFKQNTESGSDAQGQSKQQKKTGTRRINLDSFLEETEGVSEEEALAERILRDNGGTVDYTA